MIILSIEFLLERAHDAFDAREIPYRINVAETGGAEKSLDCGGLPCPDFHHHGAIGMQMRTASGSDAPVELEAIISGDGRNTGLVQANLRLKRVRFSISDVRRIRHDEIEARVAFGKKIGADEIDAVVASMARGVAARHFQRSFGNVGGDDSRIESVHRNRDAYRARAGADIEDVRFASRLDELQCAFDQRLGFRTWDEDRRRHFEIEREEFL